MRRVFARLGEKENRDQRAHQVPGRRSWASRSSGGWCSRSARSCRPTRAGRRSSPTCRRHDETPLRAARAARDRRAAAPGFDAWRDDQRLRRSASRATRWRRSRCRSATSRPTRRARWPTSRASTPATRCARRSSRTCVLRWVSEADLPALYDGAAGGRPGRARRRHDRRHHRLPRHRHLQARHLVVARAGRRAAARGSATKQASARPTPSKALHIKI